MGFNLYSLIKAGILAANGCAILHETRFLRNHGLHEVGAGGGGSMGSVGSQQGGFKQQAAAFLFSMRYFRYPLVVVNVLAIVLELLFG